MPPHKVSQISFDNKCMTLVVDGKQLTVNLETVSLVLMSASENKRLDYEISPSGYGIHWRQLDEDLSIEALLRDAA
jgi:uncharacterized protein DUF2442